MYKMPKGDLAFIVTLMTVAAAAFAIPSLRSEKFLGVALFGWWMAALMFLGPALALIRIVREKKRR